jgi:hypothetical protein
MASKYGGMGLAYFNKIKEPEDENSHINGIGVFNEKCINSFFPDCFAHIMYLSGTGRNGALLLQSNW